MGGGGHAMWNHTDRFECDETRARLSVLLTRTEHREIERNENKMASYTRGYTRDAQTSTYHIECRSCDRKATTGFKGGRLGGRRRTSASASASPYHLKTWQHIFEQSYLSNISCVHLSSFLARSLASLPWSAYQLWTARASIRNDTCGRVRLYCWSAAARWRAFD